MVLATRLSRGKKPDNQFQAELVGKNIQVIESTNPSERGMAGKIIDETRSTIKIEKKGKQKVLFKSNIKFRIGSEKPGQIIDGKKLAKRSEERLKA